MDGMEQIVALMERTLAPVPVRATRARKSGACCVYLFNTTLYNGSRREARMKVQIYAPTMREGLALEEALDRALVPVGDAGPTPLCTGCQRNGGGWLEEENGHIRIAYYDMVFRVPRNQ